MSFDQQFLLWIHSLASPSLDGLVPIITMLGSIWSVAGVAALVFAYLWWRGRRRQSVFVFTGVYGAVLVSGLLKELFQRPRPELWDRFTIELSYSMPSTHAMGTMALVACVVGILWPTRWRWYALAVGSVYLLIIGATRLYLGVHYPTDILAGWMFGALWVGVVHFTIRKLPTVTPR